HARARQADRAPARPRRRVRRRAGLGHRIAPVPRDAGRGAPRERAAHAGAGGGAARPRALHRPLPRVRRARCSPGPHRRYRAEQIHTLRDVMLPTHGRYEYSNITTRPDYSWPGGRRLAVYLALNIEAFGFGVGKGAAIAPPDQAQSHSVFSWRDYGTRVGIWRLFELLDELGMPAEAQMNTAVYDMAPDIPARLRARGDEILGHGGNNSDDEGRLDSGEE